MILRSGRVFLALAVACIQPIQIYCMQQDATNESDSVKANRHQLMALMIVLALAGACASVSCLEAGRRGYCRLPEWSVDCHVTVDPGPPTSATCTVKASAPRKLKTSKRGVTICEISSRGSSHSKGQRETRRRTRPELPRPVDPQVDERRKRPKTAWPHTTAASRPRAMVFTSSRAKLPKWLQSKQRTKTHIRRPSVHEPSPPPGSPPSIHIQRPSSSPGRLRTPTPSWSFFSGIRGFASRTHDARISCAAHGVPLEAFMLQQLEQTRDEPFAIRKVVFRDLLRQLHPDKNLDRAEEATHVFQLLMAQRSSYLAETGEDS